jgi:hypothetical protein
MNRPLETLTLFHYFETLFISNLRIDFLHVKVNPKVAILQKISLFSMDFSDGLFIIKTIETYKKLKYHDTNRRL